MPITMTPRKRIGPFTIYERQPKPRGLTKYVAGKDGEAVLHDFGKYSTAIRWCKQQVPKPTPHIVVFDDKSAVATVPMNYTILDPPHVHTAAAAVDPAMVAGILGEKTEPPQ